MIGDKAIAGAEVKELRDASCSLWNISRKITAKISELERREIPTYGRTNEKPITAAEIAELTRIKNDLSKIVEPFQKITSTLQERPFFSKPTSPQPTQRRMNITEAQNV